MSSPPKTDKFAAMAARQQQQQASSPAVGESPPVKRDKFAAMAARQPRESTNQPVKRDKLAAMVARQQPDVPPSNVDGAPRREFAAVAETVQTSNAPTEQERKEAQMREKENKLKDLTQTCLQRDAIWADLDHAEELVLQLLEVAQNTSQALATPTAQLNDLPERYQSVLQNIHSLLQPHAKQIHAYQQPTAINRMYQTRVEWRLAVEAKDILQEYRTLEERKTDRALAGG